MRSRTAFTGWVHGDFHPLNLLYAPPGRSPRPVAILDWDRLGVHPRAEEAVRGAAIFFLRPGGTLDLRKVRAFARAYRGAAGASRAELAAAVHRVWWERLNDFWMLRWRYQLCDVRTDPQFPAAAALVVWWTRPLPGRPIRLLRLKQCSPSRRTPPFAGACPRRQFPFPTGALRCGGTPPSCSAAAERSCRGGALPPPTAPR